MEDSNQSRKIFATKDWFLFPLTYLLITACFGALLRGLQLNSLGINFLYILHTHSHIALLGWAHMGFFLLLVNGFVPHSDPMRKKYYRLFWAFQLTIVGMLLFFPFQGYSPTTITFSSLFLVVSYFFTYHFFKDTSEKRTGKRCISALFARTSVFFLILSSLGPWSLGPLNANGLGGSDVYFNAIYFYLHFLYNGWFLFAIIALVFLYFEKEKLVFDPTIAKKIYRLLTISTFLAYSLSTLWITPPSWVYGIGLLSVCIQIIAVIYLFQLISKLKQRVSFSSQLNRNIAFGIVTAFLLKVILQSCSSIPTVALLIAETRSWIVAYLHLVFLGIVTPFIVINFYYSFHIRKRSKSLSLGWIIFFLGFVAHEVLMFTKGITSYFISSMGEMLLFSTLLLSVGVFLLYLNFFRVK